MLTLWLCGGVSQEVDELSIMLQQAEDQKVQADCETTRARNAIVTVNQAATRLAAAQVVISPHYLLR